MPLACSLMGRAMPYAPASRAQVNSCAPTTSQLRGNGSCTRCRPGAPGRQRAGHLKGAGDLQGRRKKAEEDTIETSGAPETHAHYA